MNSLLLSVSTCKKEVSEKECSRAALAVLVVILAACSGGTVGTTAVDGFAATTSIVSLTTADPAAGTPSSDVELVVWTDEVRAPVVEEIAGAFGQATGVSVTVESKESGDIRERMLNAGPGGEEADIFIGDHDWVGELAATGVAEPVDLGAKADEFEQVAVEAFSYMGSLYAVPYATDTIAFYYNADLVPEAPATFEELAGICAGVDGIENCVGVSGGGDVPDAYHNYPFVSALGGYVFGYDSTSGYDPADVGLDGEGAIAGITFLEEQVAAGVVGPTSYDTARALFFEGTELFWMAGPWEIGNLEGQTALNWAVTQIPTIGGNAPAPFVGAQGFFLSAFSENKVMAHSFLLDYVATAETHQALYRADSRNPAFKSVRESLANDPVASVFAASAAGGSPVPNIPEMRSVWKPLGEQIQLVRNGQLPAREAMIAAASAVQAAVGS